MKGSAITMRPGNIRRQLAQMNETLNRLAESLERLTAAIDRIDQRSTVLGSAHTNGVRQ